MPWNSCYSCQHWGRGRYGYKSYNRDHSMCLRRRPVISKCRWKCFGSDGVKRCLCFQLDGRRPCASNLWVHCLQCIWIQANKGAGANAKWIWCCISYFIRKHPPYIREVFPSTENYRVSAEVLAKVVKPLETHLSPEERGTGVHQWSWQASKQVRFTIIQQFILEL